MNRNDEYKELLKEIENTPSSLEYSLSRAQAKFKSKKRWKISLSTLASFFAVFVILVNTSVAFASACGNIPVLKELAKAVAFSPSLSAAVEHQYVQPMELEQTKDDITMKVEYVIVDQKQLDIFYTLDSPKYSELQMRPEIKNSNEEDLKGYSLSSDGHIKENGELCQITIDFMKDDMPSTMYLEANVWDNGSDEEYIEADEDDLTEEPVFEEPDYITEFSFKLDFDPGYTAQGEVIELNKTFLIDNQKLTATTIEIYPTHIRLNLADDKQNTAWLKSLEFNLENEKGKQFDKISNGITASGSLDSPMMTSHRLESTFFAKSKRLTLNITGAEWLDKDMEKIKVDLANKTAEHLPEGVTFESDERRGNSWILCFSAKSRKENSFHSIFMHDYYDEDGNEYSYNSWSTCTGDYYDNEAQKCVEVPYKFTLEFSLIDYPYDIVYLSPVYSRCTSFDEPIKITVK